MSPPRFFTQCNLVMSDIAQILPSTSCGDLISLRALRFLEVRYYCETKARAAGAYSLDCSTFPAAIWGRWQVLIYLFRDERTDNRALTMNVTGRNLPPVTSSTVWPFVEAINTHQLPHGGTPRICDTRCAR